MNKIIEVIFRDKDNLLRFLEIVALSSIPVVFLLILIRFFNVNNIFLGSDLTSLVFAINAGIFMERNGIYSENNVRDFAMIFPVFMFVICFLCLLVLFVHSQEIYPIFDNEYFKPIFSILVVVLVIFSILIGLFYALQSRLRF
jgi:hypothetical protein